MRCVRVDTLEKISDLAQQEVKYSLFSNLPEKLPNLPTPAALNGQTFVTPLNDNIVAGYKYLDDLSATGKLFYRFPVLAIFINPANRQKISS